MAAGPENSGPPRGHGEPGGLATNEAIEECGREVPGADFEAWLREVLAECADLPAEAVHEEIQALLQRVLAFFCVDRCTLFLLSEDGTHIRSTHSAAVEGIEPVRQILALRKVPWLSEMVRRGEVFRFSRIEDLPRQAAPEANFFSRNKIRSNVAVPLRVGGATLGILSIAMIRSERAWSDELLRRLLTVGEIFCNLLVHWRAHDRIRNLTGFEQMVSDISAAFVSMPGERIDDAIEYWLERIGTFLAADRCILIQSAEDDGNFRTTHIWTRKGFEVSPELYPLINEKFPWCAQEFSQGKGIRFTRIEELPEEAMRDKESFAGYGVKSHLSVPLSVGEHMLGAFATGACRIHRDWPEEIVRRVRMIGDVLVSNLQRARMERELWRRLRFEAMIAEMGNRFILVPAADVDRVVEDALEKIRCFLDVDRIVLLQALEEGDDPLAIHSCQAEGIRRFANGTVTTPLPWYTKELLEHRIVRLESVEDLPAAAWREKKYARKEGLKSHLTIPLEAAGCALAAISIESFRSEKKWPEDLIPRLRLFGQMLVNALVRREQERKIEAAVTEISRLKDQLAGDYGYLKKEIDQEYHFGEMVGTSSALEYVRYKIEEAAPTDCTVLVLGETGTGKELVARAIHDRSSRRDRPLIKVNCAALPANLIESELYGHERGAFSGAEARRLGRFETADGTTLFLDEIGELPLEMQAKLLRVLEHGEFERLGSSTTVKADVRIIAASNRDLEEEVRKGRFRPDLWYRLSVFPITVPPLRRRKEDIPLLVDKFVRRDCEKMGKSIQHVPSEVMTVLQGHDWPGNVRELENVIERAVITSHGPTLKLPDFVAIHEAEDSDAAPGKTLKDLERDHIVQTLKKTRGRIEGPNGAARILGLKSSTLRSRMQKLGVERP